jgi:excisionase family DNA binding protein
MSNPIESPLAALIESYFQCDGSAIVTPHAARWLERRLGLTQEQRFLVRDKGDRELYAVLTALHLSAVGGDDLARSDCGTKVAEHQGDTQDSETWLTTAEAADLIGVTTRAITGWCRSGKLPADRHGRSWRINRRHLNIAQALAA